MKRSLGKLFCRTKFCLTLPGGPYFLTAEIHYSDYY